MTKNLSAEELDSLLRMLVKFNPLIQQDDVCDVIDCDKCPFDKLSPVDDYGDVDTTACTSAMIAQIERIKEEC